MTTTTKSDTVAIPDVDALATRVDDAVSAVAKLDAPAKAVADELREALDALHRSGLVTIVRRMRNHEAARALLFELVDEPEVRLLFALHGIIRADPMTEARKVLAGVRPQLQSHGGDVELVRIEDGVAYVRLQGACNGCSMASVTMRTGVEEALVAGVASIGRVEVLPNEPSPTLIPLGEIGIGAPGAKAAPPADRGWVRAAEVTALADGDVTALELQDAGGRSESVIVVNIGGQLSAYVNACAHEALPLDSAMVDVAAGTLTCPWHGFCYDALSGECMSAPGAQLEALPLRIDDGAVWIRIGT